MQWLYASTQCFKIVFTVDMIVIKKKNFLYTERWAEN